MATILKIKRVYAVPGRGDGYRILVDRVWPRGLTKAKAAVDLWLREVAPSTALRKWFGHDPDRWMQFKRRYLAELRRNKQAAGRLRAAVREHGTVTLVFGAHDEEHNNAVVLKSYLRR